jgi:hypothetical protein
MGHHIANVTAALLLSAASHFGSELYLMFRNHATARQTSIMLHYL